jgi:large subunit ribosomal protein L29
MSKLGLSPKELVGQTMEELHEKRILFKKELFNLRFQKTLGELENTSRFSFVRKTIARINTELTTRLKTGE